MSHFGLEPNRTAWSREIVTRRTCPCPSCTSSVAMRQVPGHTVGWVDAAQATNQSVGCAAPTHPTRTANLFWIRHLVDRLLGQDGEAVAVAFGDHAEPGDADLGRLPPFVADLELRQGVLHGLGIELDDDPLADLDAG